MKKAMIITVGTGKEGRDIAHAICFSIKQQNPDYILFILTKVTKERTMPFILENEIMQNREYDERYLSDENDVEKIKLECDEFIKEIMKKGYKPEYIVCDYTSGTKAMSAGLTLSAINNKIGMLVYISGERNKEGRVISGTERAILLEPNRIFTEDLFKTAVNYFNNYNYNAVDEILEQAKKILSDEKFQKKVKLLSDISKAYSYWDKFDLEKANNLLNKLEENELLDEWGIKRRIEKNKQALYQECQNKFCYQRMVDLLENAKRRGEEGKFDDAVARLYRLLEYIAQFFIVEKELYQKKGNEFDTSKINLEKLPDNLREKYKETIGLEKSFELLFDLEHTIATEIYNEIKAKDSQLKKLLTLRNNSILAHGFNPIDKENFEEMFNIIEGYLKKTIKDFDKIREYIKFPKIKV